MKLSKFSLASLSFDTSTCTDVACTSNGLPTTPNSIKIVGLFKARVENVDHPNLIKYVECIRKKNERITLVFESLSNCAPKTILSDVKQLVQQLFGALYYLHNELDCVHGMVTSECLVWSGETLKLANWPINLLTDNGIALGATSLLPTDLAFIAPEQVKLPGSQATRESDIWSAGLALLKLIKPQIKLPENPCQITFCDSPREVIDHIDGSIDDSLSGDADTLNKLFESILDPNPATRASIEEIFSLFDLKQPVVCKDPVEQPIISNEFELRQEKVSSLTLSEVYHLWRLSVGRNFESEQKQEDCPPIFNIPYLIVSEKILSSDNEFRLKKHILIDTRSKLISWEVFIADIEKLDEKIFHPLILTDEEVLLNQDCRRTSSSSLTSSFILASNSTKSTGNLKSYDSLTFADLDNLSIRSSIQNQINESSKIQPIVIKEADFVYQCERMILFKRLLAGCPFLKDQLKRETSIDIPPYFRAQVWAILLDVSPDKSRELYDKIDKTTPVATDRQISVDIPRCHQYNELMASPQGHQKLARILKAWLNHNSTKYVYWQGLDSLAAPFLLLNFDNESMAFACFNSFVDKYLNGFFQKDNQLIVQRYLAMFSSLLSYHDGLLADHLEKLNFLPNLYAIPWFLTMFTHVLPLRKIMHVWDCLLLGDEKFPLCIGLAILNQLRSDLLNYNFNDCIVAFSDLPEIDIERCIRDAAHFYNSTPDKLIDLSEMKEIRNSMQSGDSLNPF